MLHDLQKKKKKYKAKHIRLTLLRTVQYQTTLNVTNR